MGADDTVRVRHFHPAAAMNRKFLDVTIQADQLNTVAVEIIKLELLLRPDQFGCPIQHCLSTKGFRRFPQLLQPIADRSVKTVMRGM
jgi:hypothetical protein